MHNHTPPFTLIGPGIRRVILTLFIISALWPGISPPVHAQTLATSDSNAPDTVQVHSDARKHLQESSQRIAELVKQRPVFNLSREIPTSEQAVNQARIDAAIRAIREERRDSLIEVVRSDNPAIEDIEGNRGIYAVPLGDTSGEHQWMSGNILPIWHLNNLDLSVIALAPAVSSHPHAATLPEGTTATAHLLLGGTSGQSGVHPYPGDIDFAEEMIISAPSEDAATQAMAALVVEFVTRSRSERSVEFDSLNIMPPRDHRVPDADYRWPAERVLDPSQRPELVRQLASTRDEGRLNSDWRALTSDGRYIVIGKIFRFIVLDSTSGMTLFTTYPMSVEFQETYVGGEIPDHAEQVTLGHYAAVMRSLALRELRKEHYLKAAKRAFNYARAIGDLEIMAKLVPIFATPAARVNESVKALEAMVMALDPDIGSEILKVNSGRSLLIEAAKVMESDLAVAPGTIPARPVQVASELRSIAAELRSRNSEPIGTVAPDALLVERLQNLLEVEILPMIRLALKAPVSVVVGSI